jgi:hypothetical protein
MGSQFMIGRQLRTAVLLCGIRSRWGCCHVKLSNDLPQLLLADTLFDAAADDGLEVTTVS